MSLAASSAQIAAFQFAGTPIGGTLAVVGFFQFAMGLGHDERNLNSRELSAGR